MNINIFKIKFLILFVILLVPVMTCSAASAAKWEIIPINYVDGDSTLIKSGGEYLLIDVGSGDNDTNAAVLFDKLKDNGITESTPINLYLSHYHGDHRGSEYEGFTYENDEGKAVKTDLFGYIIANYNVNTVYLPRNYTDDEITEEKSKEESDTKTNTLNCMGWINTLHKLYSKIAREHGAKIVSLEKGSTFSFGNIDAKVLYWEKTRSKNDGLFYNNSSLVTMFTDGKIKYLNAGDIESGEGSPSNCDDEGNYVKNDVQYAEEKILDLVKKGEINISADIFKLSHHGINSGVKCNGNISNSKPFLEKVNPKYVYATTTYKGLAGYTSIRGTVANLSDMNTNMYFNLDLAKYKEITDNYKVAATVQSEAPNYATPDIKFVIENGEITPDYYGNNEYIKRLTINYKVKNTNETLMTKTYDFSSSVNYYLHDYKDKTISGYTCSEGQDKILQARKLTQNEEYTIYCVSNNQNNSSSNNQSSNTDKQNNSISKVEDPKDEVVESPKTGIATYTLAIIGGLILVGGTYYYLRKKNIMKKI